MEPSIAQNMEDWGITSTTGKDREARTGGTIFMSKNEIEAQCSRVDITRGERQKMSDVSGTSSTRGRVLESQTVRR
jgi:hypothetical protein